MKKIKQILILFFVFGFSVEAQISSPGIPYSFTNQNSQDGKIPVVQMTSLDYKKLEAEDALNEVDNLPPRFGFPFEVNYNMKNSGQWTTLKNGDRIWQLKIHCPDALSINLTYSDFFIPKGGNFFLYNPSKSKILGAFTEQNNHSSRTFATNLIEDEQIILEYNEPAEAKQNQASIQISNIVHGYRFIRSIQLGQEKGFGDSGACNVNVNCPTGDNWQNQKRTVAKVIMIFSICSGALVNNETQDFTPYFLTANHCTDGFSAAQMNQFIFQFNYESPNCSNINGPTDQSVTGAVLRASRAESDFTLLELNQQPPPEYNVYYAGWNRTSTAASSATGIHHPQGDIKKICVENDAITSNTIIFSGSTAEVWRVDDWDVGVTEPGSSGSPLFDPNQRIVGQLCCGAAACSGTDDNDLEDYYGKFSVSWDTGTSAAERLQDWLDPNGTGITTLNGIAAPGLPPGIPTLSEWSLLNLALLLMICGTLFLLQPKWREDLE